MKNAEAYPLYWPEGWPRTSVRVNSHFKQGFGSARNFLLDELDRLGARSVVLSTNTPLRTDGLPRANMPNPADPGAAAYFIYRKHDMVLACDQYLRCYDNIYAMGKTIEAMRGIERWGASDMMERAFRGFMALPEKASTPWREVLNCQGIENVTRDFVEMRFKQLVIQHHPDTGGDRDKYEQLITAREDARRELST